MAKVLILGGTAEARALAEALSGDADIDVTTSLAGRTPTPKGLAGRVRVGGFGGADGLAAYLQDESFAAVVDATHPFAVTISANARAACDATATPRLALVRPAWDVPPGAAVARVADLQTAAQRLPTLARRAFLTVGRDSLAPFEAVRGVWMLARFLEAPADAGPFHVVTGRPPFDGASERALLQAHAIDCVVAKDAGGAATAAKIAAAAELGVPVMLIDRPKPEPGERVESVAAAVGWVRRRLLA